MITITLPGFVVLILLIGIAVGLWAGFFFLVVNPLLNAAFRRWMK